MVTDQSIDDYIATKGCAGVGGYSVALIVDGDYCCPSCAERNSFTERQFMDSWLAIHYEGPDLLCECGAILESAYGDPDNPE